MAFRASKVLAISEQTQNVDKNTVPTPAIVQINNQPFNSIKKTDANFLKVGEETSVKQAIANSKNALLSNSNPVDFVLFATDKVNFHPISTQYVPAMNQQKTSFVNTSTQQPEYRPEKLRHVVFVKPNLSFRVNPNRFSNKKASHSFIKNRNTGSNSVVDEMEVSVRERSSNRLKLNTLGIDFSVEALLSASRQGNLQAIKLMLAGGIPPDIKDAVLGVSPLLEGAKNGQLQVIQALLAKGANADIRNNEGQTALITAVKNNKKTVVKALLNGGADPSIADRNGRTALSYAVQTKNSEMISLLSRN
jgi:ankyrin repeat protein